MPGKRGSLASGPRRSMSFARTIALTLGFVVGFLAQGRPAGAEVVLAAGGSPEAIEEALAELDAGGVLVVPPGEWAWGPDDQVTVSVSDVTILGAGSDHTRLIRRESKNDVAFFLVRGVRGVRISGLAFRGVAAEDNADIDYGVFLWDAVDFRVDHCVFSHLGFAGVRTHGASRGVIDHCSFSEHYKPAVGSYGYGVAVYGTNEYTGEPFGSGEATFVEDNEMRLCRHAVAANKGGRYVFRHNLVLHNTKAHAIDAHGQEYSSEGSIGTEWIEVYENRVERPDQGNSSSPQKYAVRIRGGRGLIWGNTFADTDEGVRIDEFTPQDTGPVYVWDNELLRDPHPRGRPAYCARIRDDQDILCARKVPRAKAQRPADGRSVFSEEPPPGYEPYPYPHPRVTELDTGAGDDRIVTIREGEAGVHLPLIDEPGGDSGGPGVNTRWFVDGLEVESPSPEGVFLTRGQHLLLRIVEDEEGTVGADAALIEVVPVKIEPSRVDGN